MDGDSEGRKSKVYRYCRCTAVTNYRIKSFISICSYFSSNQNPQSSFPLSHKTSMRVCLTLPPRTLSIEPLGAFSIANQMRDGQYIHPPGSVPERNHTPAVTAFARKRVIFTGVRTLFHKRLQKGPRQTVIRCWRPEWELRYFKRFDRQQK